MLAQLHAVLAIAHAHPKTAIFWVFTAACLHTVAQDGSRQTDAAFGIVRLQHTPKGRNQCFWGMWYQAKSA